MKALRLWLAVVALGGCARAASSQGWGVVPDGAIYGVLPDGALYVPDAAVGSGPTLDLSATPFDAAVKIDAAMPVHLDLARPTGDMTATCSSYTAPTPCAMTGGLDVYCVSPGQTIVLQAQVSIAPSNTFVAMGPGSLFSPTSGNPGYITANVPFNCVVTGCADATTLQNTGKICDTSFATGAPTTVIGTALFAYVADSNAAAGDYEMAYLSQGTVVSSPNFYLRVGP